MKTFKKLALVTAIAAAPFAQAELTSIDDATLSGMTGQAGISIELSAKVDIGSVVYTDTDGLDGLAADAGSLAITGIALGGSVAGTALDNIKIDIDVDATDGLVIHLGAVNTADVLTGNNDVTGVDGATRDHQRVDFGLDVGSVSLNGGANLASAINIQGNLGPIDVKIGNDGTIDVDAYFEVTTGSMNIDVLGLGVTNLTIGDNGQPILTGAYASDLGDFQDYVQENMTADQQTAAEATDAYAYLQTAAGGSLDAATALAAVIRGGAIKGVSNMAYVQMQITTGSTGYSHLDTSDADVANWTGDTIVVQNSLQIEVTKMNMDIGMDLSMGNAFTMVGGVTVGAAVDTSLGHVAINDLNLSGTTLKIYGH